MFRRIPILREPSRPFSLVLAALLVVISCAFAAEKDTTLAPAERAQIEKAVSAFMTANSVPGISVAVVQNGQSVWSAGFGMSDLEDSAPATSSTLYRLGSISKSITAVAILQLYERGKLDLDAPVQKYCPAFPQKDSPITSRQLLAHLSGIRHYSQDGKGDVPEDSARHFASMEESLQLFVNDPLLSKPGTQFHYSTYGYALLGCVFDVGDGGEGLVGREVFDDDGGVFAEMGDYFEERVQVEQALTGRCFGDVDHQLRVGADVFDVR